MRQTRQEKQNPERKGDFSCFIMSSLKHQI